MCTFNEDSIKKNSWQSSHLNSNLQFFFWTDSHRQRSEKELRAQEVAAKSTKATDNIRVDGQVVEVQKRDPDAGAPKAERVCRR